MVIAYFTPLTGFFGGSLIGLSAATLLLFSGDILGASGVMSSLVLTPRKALTDPSMTWKLVFVSTFLLLCNVVLGPYYTTDERLGSDPNIAIVSIYGYLLGGFFIGFGSKLGNGCTTGHGICGMARLSKRSIVSVCMFMLTAFGTATLTAPNNQATSNGTKFLRTDQVPSLWNRWIGFAVTIPIVVVTIFSICYNFYYNKNHIQDVSEGDGEQQKEQPEASARTMETREAEQATAPSSSSAVVDLEGNYNTFDATTAQQEQAPPSASQEQQDQVQQQQQQDDDLHKLLPAVFSGGFFAVGLAVSQMNLPSKHFGFLNILLFWEGTYDPTLMIVMAGGCLISWISYQFVTSWTLMPFNKYARDCPIATSKFNIPTNTIIDCNLIMGGICFGLGWGVSGQCPGPAMFLAATGTIPIIVGWWPAFFLGSFIAQKIKDRQ